MNNFYKQHKILVWTQAVLLPVIGFIPVMMLIEIASVQPLFYLLMFIYLPVGQFTLAPIFTLTGVYTYYSPMLIGYMANKDQIDLHSGTSFDYLFVMSKYKRGIDIRNRILIYHLEGLLNIINKIDNGVIPASVNIIATSYFFNERSIAKFGFEPEKPSIAYRINLMVNFIELTWMYSLAKGAYSIPQVWKARKAKVNGSKLISKKGLIIELHAKMTSKTIIFTQTLLVKDVFFDQ